MEFQFEINDLLSTGVSVVSSDVNCGALKIEELHPDGHFKNWTHFLHCDNHKQTAEWTKNQVNLKQILNAIGKASSVAQGFSNTITNAEFVMERNHRVYILKALLEFSKPSVIGFLKIGEKHLYLINPQNVGIQESTLCVLDFYVVETMQRKGYGHILFSQMLEIQFHKMGFLKHENVNPARLAIDFPSPKFLSFLKKHFLLDNPKYHPNRFVTYPSFFDYSASDQNKKNKFTESSLQDACIHEFNPSQDTNYRGVADTLKKIGEVESSWRTLGISPPHYGPEVCKNCGFVNMSNISHAHI